MFRGTPRHPTGPGLDLEADRPCRGQEVRVPPLKGAGGPGRSRASGAWPGPGGGPLLEGPRGQVPPLAWARGPGRSRASGAWPGPGGRPAL